MKNPYSGKPDYAFWKRSVSSLNIGEVDPVVSAPFPINLGDKIATAGSCFAQHISRTLTSEGYDYLVTESAPRSTAAVDDGYGVFPARFGNIYTVRQLLQLFLRAYGLFHPVDTVWWRADGRAVDPFRPRVQESGFANREEVESDRVEHFKAVREMFERANVFVFTLGLTEGWVSDVDGAVFPIAPGVVANPDARDSISFRNFTVREMEEDLTKFISLLRGVNPSIKIILTVSPVALVATYEARHVLVSTCYSKSALRVVAEDASRSHSNVAYFPSYEIITGAYARSSYFEDDLREVRPEGVAHVMRLFKRHYLGGTDTTVNDATAFSARPADFRPNHTAFTAAGGTSTAEHMKQLQKIICDEEVLDQDFGS
ncbi:GSCFA domain-containing protein [Burkholderia sp. AU4i]|uniref:GSCFA domain-containing protein n=1 Tax=Burkholderia sp. AU4i TaxID=1335308 RepID=UPI0005B3816E|nr:GSCFA domain-containing protein [Burkholderia sp. AU4i]